MPAAYVSCVHVLPRARVHGLAARVQHRAGVRDRDRRAGREAAPRDRQRRAGQRVVAVISVVDPTTTVKVPGTIVAGAR